MSFRLENTYWIDEFQFVSPFSLILVALPITNQSPGYDHAIQVYPVMNMLISLLLTLLPLKYVFSQDHRMLIDNPAYFNRIYPHLTMFNQAAFPDGYNYPKYYWASQESRGHLGGVARRTGTTDRLGGNLGHHYGCWPNCKYSVMDVPTPAPGFMWYLPMMPMGQG